MHWVSQCIAEKVIAQQHCEICWYMIGETVFLRPCAPLINGMTGKWNTTGTQATQLSSELRERLAKMLEAVHGFFPETKKRMMTKQKLAKAAVFWHTSQSLMRGLHFPNEPKLNHQPRSTKHAHAQKITHYIYNICWVHIKDEINILITFGKFEMK